MYESIQRELRRQRECTHRWVLEPALHAERVPVTRLNEWNAYNGRVGTLRTRRGRVRLETGRVRGTCRLCLAVKTFHPFKRYSDLLSLASISTRAY